MKNVYYWYSRVLYISMFFAEKIKHLIIHERIWNCEKYRSAWEKKGILRSPISHCDLNVPFFLSLLFYIFRKKNEPITRLLSYKKKKCLRKLFKSLHVRWSFIAKRMKKMERTWISFLYSSILSLLCEFSSQWNLNICEKKMLSEIFRYREH